MDGEAELMQRLALGDESALGRLYERLGGNVYSLALHMLGSREDAEEVLQDSFVRLYRNARSFDPELGSVRAYVYTIARNEARTRLRRQRRSPTPVELDEESAVGENPGDPVSSVVLDGALATLEADELKLLRESFFAGYSHGEIARRSGLPLGTLKSRIRRALAKLRATLGER